MTWSKRVQPRSRRLVGERPWTQPQDEPGDDAERPLAADEELLEVVTGVVLDHPVERRDHGAVGEHGLEAQHHLAHHAVADHAIAAGIGRGIAADRRRTPRAEIEREHETFAFRRVVNLLQRSARLDLHRAAERVDGLDAIHALEGKPDFAGACDRALYEAGEATHRHDRLAGRIAGSEHAGNVIGVCGPCDCKRETGTLVGPADGALAYGRAAEQAFRTQDRKETL